MGAEIEGRKPYAPMAARGFSVATFVQYQSQNLVLVGHRRSSNSIPACDRVRKLVSRLLTLGLSCLKIHQTHLFLGFIACLA